MEDTYKIQTLEQLKTLSNKVRMRLIALHVDAKPRTIDQMAQELFLPRFKVQLHLQELLRVGLFYEVKPEEDVAEKETYYLPIARTFYSAKDWSGEEENFHEAQSQISKTLFDNFVLAYRRAGKEAERLYKAGLAGTSLKSDTNVGWLFMTAEQRVEFSKELLAMMEAWEKKYSKQNAGPNAVPWQLFCSVLPIYDREEGS